MRPPPRSTAPMGRKRRAARGALAAVAMVVLARAGAPPSGAAAQGAPGALAYRLAATYRAPAVELRAGHYARVADVAARPDGVRLVLDARQQAVHAIGAGGLPLAVWPLPWLAEGGWVPQAIGAGPGGEAVVLSTRGEGGGQGQSRFDVLDAAGRPRDAWEVDVRRTDVAVTQGGDVLTTRTRPLVAPTPSRDPGPRPRGALDVFVGGVLERSIEDDALYLPVAVDVGPDGRVWIVDWRPSPALGSVPPPASTPRPSGSGPRRADPVVGASGIAWWGPERSAQDAPSLAPAALDAAWHAANADDAATGLLAQDDVEGIVELSAELTVLGRHPFYDADDVAAGPGGVVVGRQLEVFALGDPGQPLWSGPSDTLALGAYGAALHVAAPADGRLEVALDHCRFQGLVRFERAAAPLGAPRVAGKLAWPPLDGPRHPLALAAGPDGLALLTGRYDPLGPPPRAYVGAGDGAPQAVQLWSQDGRLHDQIGLCGDDAAWFEDRGDARRVRDVAVTGDHVLAARSDILEGRRAAQPLGGWSAWPDAWTRAAGPSPEPGALEPAAHTVAIANADDLGVALDAGLDRLVWFDARTGSPRGATELGPLTGGAALSDVALGAESPDGERLVALAEPGARRVHVLAAGADELTLRGVAVIATDGAPRRVAWVPVPDELGDVIVLDDAGWLSRYAPGGARRATWAAPPGDVLVDVTAGVDGRVFAAFWRTAPGADDPLRDRPLEVLDAGIHAFAPAEGPLAPPLAASPSCRSLGDKWAAPSSVRRGDEVTVTLSIDHVCRPRAGPRRLILVVDTSRSMAWDHALARAADHLIGGLARLEPDDEVALVTFDDPDGAQLRALPTAPRAAIAGALTALRPLGDSRLGPGLTLATGLVAADRPTHIVVATDGRLTDGVAMEAEALRAAGATLTFLVYPHADFAPLDARILSDYAGGDRARVLVAPAAARVADLVASLGGREEASGPVALFVIDTLPADMRYVEGSASPAAVWDVASRTLAWRTTVASGAGRVLRYRVIPETLGLHPTNVRAVAALTDAFGTRHEMVLPVPRVDVWDRELLGHRAYLPHAVRSACLLQPPLALVLALDTSSSMAEPAGSGSGTKLDAARAAALRLLEGLRPGVDRAAIVAFDASARIVVPLGANRAERAAGLAGLATAPGTALDLGLVESGRALEAAPVEAMRAIILLSDGRTSGRPEDALAAAAALEAQGILRYAIGLGEGADRALLEAIASGAEAFVGAPSAEGLDALFEGLLERMRCAAGR